eukprot:CAMPEP_0198726662 /NCGR_PEP_ID=MMETSP1475-20131203/3642_1 /TAXON_ID= ORGANISM="Unidentified sp., Strain CCMP1999" /NCGR_SAMPLE_ID=MMETSP1475 /ASSEMBLY_ACC=CAM_ASM_001111 /LENGTH=98 /DNA_ID=CAMNT_0044488611 /DNA_START=1276 /DNA_END=1569 /DNA_ORIENTATION=+
MAALEDVKRLLHDLLRPYLFVVLCDLPDKFLQHAIVRQQKGTHLCPPSTFTSRCATPRVVTLSSCRATVPADDVQVRPVHPTNFPPPPPAMLDCHEEA